MARSRNTRNMERVSDETPSARRTRKNAEANGRGARQAFTSGARSVMISNDTAEAMRERWNVATGKSRSRNAQGRFQKDNGNVAVMTSTPSGRMSEDGRTAGGRTHGFSKNTGDGKASGGLLTRRQRYYQVRAGLGLAGG